MNISLSTIIGRVLRYLWTAPCSIVGLCFALPALFLDGGVRIVAGVVEVFMSKHKESNVFLKLLPFNAITFGHVVIAQTKLDLYRLRAHEHEHVRQYEKWGILFFVAYIAAGLWALFQGHHPYWDNWFEVEARANEIDK